MHYKTFVQCAITACCSPLCQRVFFFMCQFSQLNACITVGLRILFAVKVSVRNFPSAAVSAATFGERPRQAADAAHLLLLAGSQRRCSVDRAGALKVCLRSVEIFDCKD